MTLICTILGCGSSAGVPRVGTGWGACDPKNPKNRRRRCSVLLEQIDAAGKRTVVLIDTSPDLRAQLLDAEVKSLDAVLLTHDHADHTHGIDDLRPLALHLGRRIPVYFDAATAITIRARFEYGFATPPGSEYPPFLGEHRIAGEGGAITLLPFAQAHGDGRTLGFRVGGLAYSCDVSGLPDESLAALQDLDVWVLDALRYRAHPSHFSVEDAIGWVGRVRPKRAYLTNLHTDLDYEALRRQLPRPIEPAFDGLKIEF
jgi:phosphoribosyl 1,2-cyclic phosphate phosphodiesterase